MTFFDSYFYFRIMQKRMVDIIKSLPRLKEKHIRPNFRPENPDSKSSYVKNNVTVSIFYDSQSFINLMVKFSILTTL